MVKTNCDWCGIEIDVHPYRLNNKFITCCKEHRSLMLQKYMKEKWEGASEERREEWKAHIREGLANNGRDFGTALTDYHRKLRPARVAKVIELMSRPPEKPKPNERNNGKVQNAYKRYGRGAGEDYLPRGTCTLIAAHHEMLKHDPERLSTEFMQKICGVDCKCKKDRQPMVWKDEFAEIRDESP